MEESFGRADGVEPDEAPGSDGHSPSEHTRLRGRLTGSGLPWRRIALVAGGTVVTAAGSAVVTLAATHKTAKLENAKAYAHGMRDALHAVQKGVDPFDI